MLQRCAEVIGVPSPASVISNTDLTVKSLLAIANEEGEELMLYGNWVELERVHTFTTTASTAEYDLPDDFSRLVPNTEWDRSDLFPIWGPLSPVEWQAIKSGLIGSGVVHRRYRLSRSATTLLKVIHIDPTPTTTGDTLAFEYISTHWCKSAGAVGQTEFAADSDEMIIPEKVLKMGIIAKFKASKGFGSVLELNAYEAMKNRQMGQNRPAKALSMSGNRRHTKLITTANVPDTGYG